LRQNFISVLDPEVFHLLTQLEELDLYDNKIKSVDDALDKLSGLSYVFRVLGVDEMIIYVLD
jgi:protein phosphatase 1 regulatory subunit 7